MPKFDDALMADLMRDEGYRPLVYDDATGLPIKPGSVVVGHPTIAHGWALDVTPVSPERARIILIWFISDKTAELFAALPWAATLPDNQRRALLNMAFNMGVARLLGFKKMLAALKAGDYKRAAIEAKDSLWYRQVGERGPRICALMAAGANDPIA